jgi:hypothetical protein
MIEPEPKGSNFGRTWPNLSPENCHINFKMTESDRRFSQKGRARQHWFTMVPM